jgi:hypothetical protein
MLGPVLAENNGFSLVVFKFCFAASVIYSFFVAKRLLEILLLKMFGYLLKILSVENVFSYTFLLKIFD